MQKKNLLAQLQQLLWLLDSKQHVLVPSPLLQGLVVCQVPVDQVLGPQDKKLLIWKAEKGRGGGAAARQNLTSNFALRLPFLSVKADRLACMPASTTLLKIARSPENSSRVVAVVISAAQGTASIFKQISEFENFGRSL